MYNIVNFNIMAHKSYDLLIWMNSLNITDDIQARLFSWPKSFYILQS